jgi:uncharacterized protein YggE
MRSTGRSKTLLLLCAAAGFAVADSRAQPPAAKDNGRTIRTSGVGQVKYAPDGFRVQFFVLTKTPAIKQTRDENEKHAQKLREALAGLGIAGMKISSASENLHPVTSLDRNAPTPDPITVAFQVRQSFTVVVRNSDVQKLRQQGKQVLDVIVENGGLGTATASSPLDELGFIGGRGAMSTRAGGGPRLEFFREDVAEIRKEALRKALQDATATAQALAGDAKIEVLEISYGSDASPSAVPPDEFYPVSRFAAQTAATSNLSNDGELTLSVIIQATFRY